MKVSICIPTWEQYGKGVTFLTRLLKSIESQDYTNYEVVISDHSLDNSIFEVTKLFEEKFDIVYFKNPNKRGNGPANTNSAILMANGDIVKIMFQDDFFFSKKALSIISKRFTEKNCKWLVNGCNHTNDGNNYYRQMVPNWNDRMHEGVNTISSPSVLSFVKDVNCLFDENLVMLMDCEMYYQLYIKYGLPEIISDTLITNHQHELQISSLYTGNMHQEINYVKNKHKL